MKINKRFYRNAVVLLSLMVLTAVVVVSCGGDTGGGHRLLQPSRRGISVRCTGRHRHVIERGGAADMASGYIPPSYAPGKRALKAGTAAIANIDPRLKT